MARKTAPRGHVQPDLFPCRRPLAERLLRSLCRTLDLDKTIEELGISRKEAKETLCAIAADFSGQGGSLREKKEEEAKGAGGAAKALREGEGVSGAQGPPDRPGPTTSMTSTQGRRGQPGKKKGAGRGTTLPSKKSKAAGTRAPAGPSSGEPAGKAGRGKEQDGAFRLYVDGGSRGNPGPSGAGAVILDPSGRTVKRLKKHLGIGTNNRAEYEALIMGLEAARALGAERVHVYADSELVVRQVTGRYRVKSPALEPLYRKAKGLLTTFTSYRISHVPRSANSEADGLANEAMDRGARR